MLKNFFVPPVPYCIFTYKRTIHPLEIKEFALIDIKNLFRLELCLQNKNVDIVVNLNLNKNKIIYNMIIKRVNGTYIVKKRLFLIKNTCINKKNLLPKRRKLEFCEKN